MSTFFEHGAAILGRLAHATGLGSQEASIRSTFRLMMEPWGDRLLGDTRGWSSDVADDRSPYEFSVVLGGAEPELRFLVEPQGEEPSPASRWEANVHLARRLAREFDVPLERLHKVEMLFRPQRDAGFAAWYSASFRAGCKPQYKIYWDAQARGRYLAEALCEETLWQLGFQKAWPSMTRAALCRGPAIDEPKYISLDLHRDGEARVKLYVRHHAATLADIEQVLATAFDRSGEIARFCEAMMGHQGPYVTRPVFSCTAFTVPEDSEPAARTLYVPIASYVPHDEEARRRITTYLQCRGLAGDLYEAVLGAFVSRPLAARGGLHSYVGLREGPHAPRVTVYLSPDTQPSQVPIMSSPLAIPREPAEAIVHRFEHEIVLRDHPFLVRLGREPVKLGALWLVMANFWEGVVHDFPKRLAHVAAKVHDDKIRCILVKQLNDELGEGDYARAHKPLFHNLVAALAPYRPSGDLDRWLAPGRTLYEALNRPLCAPEPYESVGAVMLLEIYGKQIDIRMGEEFRRQDQIDQDALEWLHLHEDLEVDHAGDSLRLARLIPHDDAAALEATWRGAEAVGAASREYFDHLYRIWFS
jgi:DMATS type aromatic prenyltransferase